MSFAVPGLVETSTNLASVKFVGDDRIVVTSSQRSSVESAKTYVMQMVESVFALAGADVAHSDGYPGWTPDPDVYKRQTMRRWAAQYGRAVVGSVVVAEQERFRNRMFFVKPSGETAWYDKRHLFLSLIHISPAHAACCTASG